MDPTTFQRISLILALLFFGMAILGIVGEILGWWNDVGELLTIIGTLGGMILAWSSLSTSSTELQVDRVHAAVVDNGDTLDTIDGKLDQLAQLDAIQLELDRQTGVLDEQLSVLTDVRDGL